MADSFCSVHSLIGYLTQQKWVLAVAALLHVCLGLPSSMNDCQTVMVPVLQLKKIHKPYAQKHCICSPHYLMPAGNTTCISNLWEVNNEICLHAYAFIGWHCPIIIIFSPTTTEPVDLLIIIIIILLLLLFFIIIIITIFVSFFSARQHKACRLEIDYIKKWMTATAFLVDVVIECVKKWQGIAPLDCHVDPLEKVHHLILVICSRSCPSSNLFH